MPSATQTVRDIALQQPTSIRVFQHLGIDFCCGGRKPLAEACAASNLEVDAVLAALEAANQVPAPPTDDWSTASLQALSQHIVATHHAYAKAELPRLALLAHKVVLRHGDTQPELPLIQSTLAQLDAELTHHFAKEETVLFPYITELEQSTRTNPLTASPRHCFGSVANPIAMMTEEHDAAGELLAQIRQLSHQFTTPIGACPTYCAFYQGLSEFEQDLHHHIHLENNILFPRAIHLESTTTA